MRLPKRLPVVDAPLLRSGQVAAVPPVRNVITISDIHAGCQLGLLSPAGIRLDENNHVMQSPFQEKTWAMWREFWDDWVPRFCKGEPFAVVFNGDGVDGRHHGSTHQITQNLAIQQQIAYDVLYPVKEACEGRLYYIRGTEAHVGPSAETEEALAKSLGAIPNSEGKFSRWELWARLGPRLIHFLHHIGATGSSAYEATAVHKERVEAYAEAGRFGDEPPDAIVRSHRHRCLITNMPSGSGYSLSIVTPGWQGKTPFTWKIPGARLAQPQFGGVGIRQGDEELYARYKAWRLERPPVETL